MVKIITVHGTNAGADSDTGDQWWQRRSGFQEKLSARLGEKVEFEPFHWSGANSEMARRQAGGRLAKKLTEEREPPVVIGHSHGGSVALHALSRLFINNRKSPERAAGYFRSLLTVGTPMIRHRAAWNPIFRFNTVGQLFAIYAALITLLVAGEILGRGEGVVQDLGDLIGESILTPLIDLEGGPLAFAAQLFTPAMLFAGILPIVILFYFARRSSQRHHLFRSNRLISVVKSIYRPLNHAGDEAIAALRAGVGLKLKLIDRKTVRASIFAPVALLLAGVLAVRTISEQVVLDFDGPLIGFAQDAMGRDDAPMVVAPGDDPFLDEWEMIEEAVPEAEAIGQMMLSVRDAGSRIRRLSGNLRRNATVEDRRRSGLTRETVYLLDDYVVLDVPTAMRFTNKADLLSYLEVLAPDAPAGITLGPQGECAHYAVYLTQDGHDQVMEWAQALPTGGAGGISWAPPEPIEARSRAEEAPVEPCTRPDALPLPTEGTPLGALLSEDRLLALAGEALVSQGPLAVAQAEDGPQMYGEVWLPILRRGEALVFERSSFNDAKFACLFAGIRAPLIGLNPLREGGSARLRSLNGFCDQIEGAEITFYDTATTVLAEIEHELRNIVEFGGGLIDRGIKAVGLRDRDVDRSAADLISDDTVETGILAPVYFVLSVIICAWLVAWLVSLVLAPVLSGIFNSVIKQNVFGNDGHGEEVVQVAPGLDFEGKTVGTLPAEVQQDLTDYVQQYAPQTIARLRDIVTFSTSEADGHLPVQQLSESLTWKELIHTAYFDVDSFVEHVAQMLEETGAVKRA